MKAVLNPLVVLSAFFAVALTAFCGVSNAEFDSSDDVFVKFSSSKNDRYRNNQRIASSECYALIWTKAGETFAGFKSDGTLIDPVASDLFGVAFLRPGKSCLFEITKDEYDQRVAEGWTMAVYLVDTRGANNVPYGLDDTGKLIRVNRWGLASGVVEVTDSGVSGLPVREGGALANSVLSKDVSKRRITITGMRVGQGGQVVLNTEGGDPSCTYAIAFGNDVAHLSGALDPQDGAEHNEFRATVPDAVAAGKPCLFTVVRP